MYVEKVALLLLVQGTAEVSAVLISGYVNQL